MTNKIVFSIEDAQLIDDRPNSSFSILSLDFFASGRNRHDTYVSEETLERTKESIKNAPLVWKYDPKLDDAWTHDPEEIPCGFIPESAIIESKRMPDGRLMLSVKSYIWKKYSGRIMEFFKRDGDKPISVEISIFETETRPDGLIELLDYKFDAVTILGSFVTPAIPLAKATVLQFTKEYNQAYALEFGYGKYNDVDFTIPESVKKNAEKGMGLNKKSGAGSVSLSNAKYILKNNRVTPERIRQIFKTLSSRKYLNVSDDENSDDYVSFLLSGGADGYNWSKTVCEKLSELDNQKVAYFDKESKEVMSVEEEKLEQMAQTEEEEKKETPEEEKAETPEEEKKEKEEEKEFSLDPYLDVKALLAFLENETEVYQEVAEEFAKPYAIMNYGKVMGAMYSKMCKMAEMCNGMAAEKEEMAAKFAEAEEKAKAYMAENEELKKFKAEKDQAEFSFAVDATLKDIETKTQIPAEELEFLREKSLEFSIETIDGWKNFAKARALDFAIKSNGNGGDYKVYGLPFPGERKVSNSIWKR